MTSNKRGDSMSEKDGGPAFPAKSTAFAVPDTIPREYIEQITSMPVTHTGMTLRDYFAAQAMQGICATCDSDGVWQSGLNDEQAGLYRIARLSYQMADAMLAARESCDE